MGTEVEGQEVKVGLRVEVGLRGEDQGGAAVEADNRL